MNPTDELEKSALLKIIEAKDKLIDQLKEESAQKDRHLSAKDRVIECQSKTIETRDITIANKDKIIDQMRITLDKNAQEIKTKFDPSHHSQNRAKVYEVCLENMRCGIGLTNEQILKLFHQKYPAIPQVNIIRRVYELGSAPFGNLLFRHSDPDGKTRWFLRQNPSKSDFDHIDAPIS